MMLGTDIQRPEISSFFRERRPHRGLTYEQYKKQWKEKLGRSLKGLDKRARKYHFYSKYNDERAQRVEEHYTMSDAFEAQVDAIDRPQLWMVLTEDWCLDSAYSLPVLYAAESRNTMVDIRILYRDANLDIMDVFLTNESRSIPKLVAFSESGEPLFDWGPRPARLQRLRTEWKESGEPGNIISQKSVEWYEADGWLEIENELVEALARSHGGSLNP